MSSSNIQNSLITGCIKLKEKTPAFIAGVFSLDRCANEVKRLCEYRKLNNVEVN